MEIPPLNSLTYLILSLSIFCCNPYSRSLQIAYTNDCIDAQVSKVIFKSLVGSHTLINTTQKENNLKIYSLSSIKKKEREAKN